MPINFLMNWEKGPLLRNKKKKKKREGGKESLQSGFHHGKEGKG